MKLPDETIMPDGRPLFAWRNEVEMLRSEARGAEDAKREVARMIVLLDIIQVEQNRELHTGDYLIRVRRGDIVNSYSDTQALQKGEVTRI